MRDILFRGKRTDKGNWVYGVPTKDTHNEIVIVEYVFECDEYDCQGAMSFYVDENTIGQYTGLTDKNGKKIFEGDIIMYGLIPCVVKWEEENARFMLYEKGIYTRNGFNTDTMKLKEVIGNIHDNPELLKGE